MTFEELQTICVKRESQYEDVMVKIINILKGLGHVEASEAIVGLARTYAFLPLPSPQRGQAVDKPHERTMGSSEIYEKILRVMRDNSHRTYTIAELRKEMPYRYVDAAWFVAWGQAKKHPRIHPIGGRRSMTFQWDEEKAVSA